MKGICRSVVIVAVLALCLLCTPLDQTDAESKGVALYEVYNQEPGEGVSLHNYGSADVDLCGYYISDSPELGVKEGYISFTKHLMLPAGETFTFVKEECSGVEFVGRHTTFFDGDAGVTYNKSFDLAKGGDDVYLFKGDMVIDVFFYGNSAAKSDLWPSDTFKFRTGCYALRISEGNGAENWSNTRAGLTTNYFDPNLKFDASVTPFIFPDCGGIPIYRALEDAEDTVYITMYELTNTNLYALLCELENRTGDDHVDVVLLLEKSPLGYKGLPEDSKKMKALIDAGGEVFFIGGENDRYSYVHAKYCIIDGERVIITSENWTTGNLNGSVALDPYKSSNNRGWGVIVDSKEYAEYMLKVFNNDCDPSLPDVWYFDEVITNVTAATLTYKSPTDEYPCDTYRAEVTPLMSPDSSFVGTNYYISNAHTRVYSEQQDLSSDYMKISASSPLSEMAKIADKVDVRFILCLTNNEDAEYNVDMINLSTKIKAATMEKPYVHNKGVICDDTTIVSSVNWTPNSFNNNREMAVAIHSKDVADFYAGSFLKDFDRNYTFEGLNVEFTEISEKYDKAGKITVSVSVDQEGTFTYAWELDGVSKETTNPRTSFDVVDGDHTLTVTVKSSSGSTGMASASFHVGSESQGEDSFLSKIKAYLAPIIAVLVAIVAAIGKMASGKKKRR